MLKKTKKTVKKKAPVKAKKTVKKTAKKPVKVHKELKSKKSQKTTKKIENDIQPRMGRPPKDFEPKLFENLCSILCTEEEIAGVFSISVRTLERKVKKTYKDTFVDVYRRFSSGGKVSLRRAQFSKALSGNPAMLKWLGANILGQKEKLDMEHTGDLFDSIQVEIIDKRQDANENPDNEQYT